VLGLDACEHHGHSVLDHGTLALSSQLPLPFLRGCGLPEKFIEYLHSPLDQPIQINAAHRLSYPLPTSRSLSRIQSSLLLCRGRFLNQRSRRLCVFLGIKTNDRRVAPTNHLGHEEPQIDSRIRNCLGYQVS
jgi:hypothetical protein